MDTKYQFAVSTWHQQQVPKKKNDNPESSNSIMIQVIECYHKNELEFLPSRQKGSEQKMRQNN